MTLKLGILLVIGYFVVAPISGYDDNEDFGVTLAVKGSDIEIKVPYNAEIKSVFFSTELDDKCNSTGYTFHQNNNENGPFIFTQNIQRKLMNHDKLQVLGVFETEKQVIRKTYYFEIDDTGNGVHQTECKDDKKIIETQIDDIIVDKSSSQPIFHETFIGSLSSNWIHEIRSPLYAEEPECAAFTNHTDNCDIINGTLHLMVKWRPGNAKVYLAGCTTLLKDSDIRRKAECAPKVPSERPSFYSAKISSSSLQFRYGRVVVRARFPLGDWLFPYIILQSRKSKSEASHATQIRIAYSRGNKILQDNNMTHIGREVLYGSAVYWENGIRNEFSVKKRNVIEKAFGENFHDYSVIWHRDSIIFKVDDITYGKIENPEVLKHFNKDDFFIILGLGVGGNSNFPKEIMLNTHNIFKKSQKPHLILSETYKKEFVYDEINEAKLLVESVKVYPTFEGEE